MAKKRIRSSLERLCLKFSGLKERLPDFRIVHNIVMTQTTATDGQHLFYNSRYISTLTDDQLDVLVMHEILHVLKGHIYPNGKDLTVWNIACDFNVNNDLVLLGMELPPGMHESRFDSSLDAEAIYQIIYPWKKYKMINSSTFNWRVQ